MAIVSTVLGAPRATAATIIRRALRLVGVVGIGEAVAAEEMADAMTSLNSMVGLWANERLIVPVATLDEVTLTPGKAAYTIGPGGEINTTRPTNLDTATHVELGGISYELTPLTVQEYGGLTLKSYDTSIPQGIWYLQTYPLGQITLYPVPQQAMTLKLWSWKPFVAFDSQTQEIALPPGYDEALATNLAVMIAPEYEREAPPTVKKAAVMSKKLIKRTNLEVPRLAFDSAVLPTTGAFNIYSGGL